MGGVGITGDGALTMLLLHFFVMLNDVEEPISKHFLEVSYTDLIAC